MNTAMDVTWTDVEHVEAADEPRGLAFGVVIRASPGGQVMILSHDRERGRVSLSTKKLEPTPGDMIRNPNLVFEKA